MFVLDYENYRFFRIFVNFVYVIIYMFSDFKKKNFFRLFLWFFVIERYLIELNKVFDLYIMIV